MGEAMTADSVGELMQQLYRPVGCCSSGPWLVRQSFQRDSAANMALWQANGGTKKFSEAVRAAKDSLQRRCYPEQAKNQEIRLASEVARFVPAGSPALLSLDPLIFEKHLSRVALWQTRCFYLLVPCLPYLSDALRDALIRV